MKETKGTLEAIVDRPADEWVILVVHGRPYMLHRETSLPIPPEMLGQEVMVRCILGNVVAEMAAVMAPKSRRSTPGQ